MTKYELAKWYGEGMRKFGEFYYSPHIRPNNPYYLMIYKSDYQALTEEEKKALLAYGSEMQAYGMAHDNEKPMPKNPFEDEDEKE